MLLVAIEKRVLGRAELIVHTRIDLSKNRFRIVQCGPSIPGE